MFRDLRAGTKFLILCLVSLALTSVATYALLVEKQIAINFARKELVGSKYLALLQSIYVTVLKNQANGDLGDRQGTSARDAIDSLARADAETSGTLHIAKAAEALATTLRGLETSNSASTDDIYSAALKTLRDLAARIGDDSNIILDPVLDTYHVGNIVVTRFPTALEEIGQAQLLARASKNDSVDRNARFIALNTLLRANIEGVNNDLKVAQRGGAEDRLKQAVEPALAAFATKATAYLDALRASIGAGGANVTRPDAEYASAVRSALDAWKTTQQQLDQLLIQRIDDLQRQRLLSLVVIGTLGMLGLFVAFLTYRDMIVPIRQLADLANNIRETKNYGLRSDYKSRDEIGGLAASFNEMLGELEVAREREMMRQAEISRVSRLTTMGAMVASIAHEIRQPLAALVANSHAGTRWLERKEPNLEEARSALASIAQDGHRANEVITSISMMFKKNANRRVPVDTNEVVNDVINLSRGELRSRKIALHTKLAPDLPQVPADPVQLREVLLNLIMNAAEAMNSTDESRRVLAIVSMPADDGISITVEDSGIGLDPKNAEQIFEAFFTTKPTGMGMGLAICRSIIAAHGGRLWASPGHSCGTVFHVVLPLRTGQQASAEAPTI
jgi:signal transduction histidine kinase